MKDLSEFLPFVLPWARGASDPAAEAAILQSAITFCRESTCWRSHITDVPIKANARLIPVPVPEGAILQEVRYVDYMSGAVDPDTPDNRRAHCVDDTTIGPVPRLWGTEIDDEGNVQLRILPLVNVDIPAALRIRCYLQPEATARQLPDFLLARFATGIGNGAVAILHSTDEPWAVPGKSAQFGALARADQLAAGAWANSMSMRDSRYTKPVWR